MPKSSIFDGEVRKRGNSLQELGLREFQEYEVAAFNKKRGQLLEDLGINVGENDIVKKNTIKDRASMFEPKRPSV